MRKWALLGIVLALMLALAACDGDDDKDKDGEPDAGGTSEAVAPDADATGEVDEGADYSIYEPGLQPLSSGLTMITYSVGERDGTAYFFGEVRNDSGSTLSRVESLVYALDSEGYLLDTINAGSLLGDDIPPGHVFYVGRDFPAPETYADAQVWVRSEANEPASQGFYNLPVTVDYQGAGETAPYVVRGTVQNNSGKDFFTLVIDAVLVGPDDDLVGLAHGLPATIGPLSAGESVTFEASFGFVAIEPDLVQGVKVSAAGYTLLE